MTAELKQTARVVWHKWPCFALAIGLAIYTYVAVRSGGSLTDVEKLPALDRAINATHSFFLYPWRWLVPLGLSPLYPLELLPRQQPRSLGIADPSSPPTRRGGASPWSCLYKKSLMPLLCLGTTTRWYKP